MADGIETRIEELKEATRTAEEVARRFPDTMIRDRGYTSESITLDMCDIVREEIDGDRVYLRAGAKVGHATVWMARTYTPMLWTVLDRLMRDPVGKAALLASMEDA